MRPSLQRAWLFHVANFSRLHRRAGPRDRLGVAGAKKKCAGVGVGAGSGLRVAGPGRVRVGRAGDRERERAVGAECERRG